MTKDLTAGAPPDREPAFAGRAGGLREHRYVPPRGATQVLLVRHGESAPADPDKPFPMLDGHGDPDLGEEGHAQARTISERLAAEPLDAVYVSTLKRTQQTAAPLLKRTGMEQIVEPDLREAHLGDWEGHLWRIRIAERHPLAVEMIDEQRWDVIPGAEPADAFSDRVVGVLNRIAARHAGRAVAVFTHAGVIGAAMAHACHSSPYPFNAADNASISQVVITEDRWRIRRFNDTAHLMPLVAVA
jgi:2,3-bisphosphoglycerate-dependent phosphoglycerate mutase